MTGTMDCLPRNRSYLESASGKRGANLA